MTRVEAELRDALFAYMTEHENPERLLVEDDPKEIELLISLVVQRVNGLVFEHNLGWRLRENVQWLGQ